VVAVSVGQPRRVRAGEREVVTGIWKAPVPGPVAVTRTGLAGDGQADLEAHGGPDKAVYAYAEQDYAWWSAELGRPLEPGMFGENLTVRGLDLQGARIGEQWHVGTVLLEVAQPRIPCYKLGLRFDDPAMPRRFARALRPGAYLRVREPGALAAGDAVTVLDRPDHDVTIGLVAAAYHRDRSLAPRLAEAPQLPAGWVEWASSLRTPA